MRHDPALGRAPRLPALHAVECRCALCAPIGAGLRAAVRRLVVGRGGSADAYVQSIGFRAAALALALVPVRAALAAIGIGS